VSTALAQDPGLLVERYVEHLASVCVTVDPGQVACARAWCARFGGPDGFTVAPLKDQLDLPRQGHRFVDWLIVTRRLIPSADYVMARKPRLGLLFRRTHADWHASFIAGAAALGFKPQTASVQWVALAQICTVTGVAPDKVTTADLVAGKDLLVEAGRRWWKADAEHNLRSAAFGLEATLFHLGVTASLTTTKRRNIGTAPREQRWATIPPVLAATIRHYLQQMAVGLRPATIERYEVWLRQFATFLAELDPPVTSLSQVTRANIEAFKIHLRQRASTRGKPLNGSSVRDSLIVLRNFFERLIEWDHPDAPVRAPVFAGDVPIKDEPLPRFLDDAASTKLLRAARAYPDLFTRVCVEVLARTGLRRSEFIGLGVDASVRIGDAWWLHVPVGKLHNNRFIPLHPGVKALLDEWLAARPPVRSDLMFIEQGRPIGVVRVRARWPLWRPRQGSARSRLTSSVTRWPPRPSTGG
jgi:site-specific recombinase XerD